MSSQKNPDWRMLGQDLIFQKIMMMVGLVIIHEYGWSSQKSSSDQSPLLILLLPTFHQNLIVQDVYKEESL